MYLQFRLTFSERKDTESAHFKSKQKIQGTRMKQVIGVDTFKNSSTPFFLFCFLKRKKLSGSSVTEREINAQLEQAPVESRLKPRRCSFFLHLPPLLLLLVLPWSGGKENRWESCTRDFSTMVKLLTHMVQFFVFQQENTKGDLLTDQVRLTISPFWNRLQF